MVHYNTNQQIVTPWSAGGTMQASIVLDQPGNVSFTNLDEISGRVVVRCAKSADVSNIVVKLEGESRTRLLSPPGPNGEKARPQLEYHKILYRLQTVFPPADVAEGRSQMGSKGSYTLPPGQHEYPWKFKIPFNNSCHAQRSSISNVGISNFGLEVAKAPTQHVHKTLPPTLSGFPGEAEIRYFVKVTIARHSIFKENPRAHVPFNFFPIEPPRPPVTGSQVYARQKHSFTAFPDGPKKEKRTSIFGMKSSTPSSPVVGDNPGTLALSVDVRLPEPAILTCAQDIPLAIILKRLNPSSEQVFLQSLQILLIANTKVRAHDTFRTEQNSWVMMSRSNMGIRVAFPSSEEGAEASIDEGLWRGQTLPNTVAPSFETCNISRSYALDVRIGLSYDGSTTKSSGKPQSIVLPLRLDTLIYSGIAPPPEILERMAQARANVKRPLAQQQSTPQSAALDEKLKTEGRKSSIPVHVDAGPESDLGGPSTPIQSVAPQIPARPGEVSHGDPMGYDEAPPSYEDAIAADLPPMDGQRPDYAPPPIVDDEVLRRDEKRGWV